jgi:phenylpropionate dioxygenase-like ring-hydroxylating dioxygenase large terminal subunit
MKGVSMTINVELQDVAKILSISETSEIQQTFEWQKCWYPIVFCQDLPKGIPHSFSFYDEPLVLFRNEEGQLTCLIDRCPHRAAKLSDGQIIDGRIECLYHGWQFGKNGQCLRIPQLSADAKIPNNASVKFFTVVEHQGIVWMWAGNPEEADTAMIPTIPDLDRPGFASTDFVRDLPYDQSYFIENVLDPAHLHISHHGILGNRKYARPLEMEVVQSSAAGIQFKCKGMDGDNAQWAVVNFIAPNIVSFTFNIESRGWLGGTVLYSMPLGQGRCRIFLRNYRNFMTHKIKMTPLWLDHIRVRNRVLEGDLPLVVGQKLEIERLDQSLKEIYLPLKTSDTFVVEYRKWLDKFGSSLPYYQGYVTSKNVHKHELYEKPELVERFSQHTKLCVSCSQAHKVTGQLKQIFVGVAIALAAIAIVVDGLLGKTVLVLASLLAVILAVVSDRIKVQFENSDPESVRVKSLTNGPGGQSSLNPILSRSLSKDL